MRRGDVRSALLVALLDGPGHGYELINLLEEKSDGRWRPSPGSVYPTLQMLADEGLATSSEHDGRNVFAITDEGRTKAEERVESHGLPWESMDSTSEHGNLRFAIRDLHQAGKQVAQSGTPETVEKATEILNQAKKSLYKLLAEE